MDGSTIAIIVAIVASAIALGGAIVPGQRDLRRDVAGLHRDMAEQGDMLMPTNGAGDRLAAALRDVVTDAVAETTAAELAPIRTDLDQLAAALDQQGMLLRSLAANLLPAEVLADAEGSTRRDQPGAD